MRRIRFFAPDCYVSIDTMEKTATVYRKKPGFVEAAEKLRHASDARILLEMGRLAYGDLVDIQTLISARKSRCARSWRRSSAPCARTASPKCPARTASAPSPSPKPSSPRYARTWQCQASLSKRRVSRQNSRYHQDTKTPGTKKRQF